MNRPSPSPGLPRRLSLPGFWTMQLLGWSAFALLSLPLKFVTFGSATGALLVTACQLPLALLLSAGLRWFYRRPQLRAGAGGVPPLWILLGATLAGAIDTAISLPLNHVLALTPETKLLVPGLFFFRAAIYLIWSLAYFLTKILVASREQAFLAAVNDERHRLELLRYQLNPDFLARSLTAISHEIAENPAAARAMVVQLAAFYGDALRRTDHGRLTTIRDELSVVRAYLDLETLRRPGALQVSYAVDESLLELPLPPVMLLPLAEQAAQAGGTRANPLHITVTVERNRDGGILLEVANSGPPAATAPAASDVADVRANLERHYPGRHRFALRQDSFTTRATIYLPLPA
jgi:two-component system LytT family sensor kinase